MSNVTSQSNAPESIPKPKQPVYGLTGIYLGAIFFGAVVIVVSGENIHQNWWLLLIVMFAYLFMGLDKAKREGSVIEFSDSVYYLGFILTLIALLQTFLPLIAQTQVAQDEKLREPIKMLGYFGAGLITTVVGVIGRTALQMYFRPTQENIQAINEEIERVAIEYLGNLEEINGKSRHILAESLGKLEQELKDGTNQIRITIDACNRELQTAIAGIQTLRFDTKGLQNSVSNVIQSADELSQGLQQRTQKLGTLYEVLAKEIAERMSESKATYKLQSDELVTTIRTTNEALVRSGTEVQSSISDIAANINNVSKSLDGVASNVSGLGSRIAEVNLSGITAAIDDSKSKLEGLAQSIEKTGTRIEADGGQPIVEALAALKSHVGEINSVLEEIGTAIHVRLESLGEHK